MTTMSMTGGLSRGPTDWRERVTAAASHVCEPDVRDATMWEECCDRVLEVSGGLALALVPFAALAWMFVAW